MFPSEFWAAIVGAVVGGIISFLIQLFNIAKAAKERKEARDEQRKAVGFSLLHKFVKIHSNIELYRRYIEDAFARINGTMGEPWQTYQPSANHASYIEFSSEEMGLLFSLKNDDLFNDILPYDGVHNSTIDIFKKIDEGKQNLVQMLPAEMEGLVGKIELSEVEARFVRPRVADLNHLLLQARAWSEKEAKISGALLIGLQSLLEEKLGIGAKITPV